MIVALFIVGVALAAPPVIVEGGLEPRAEVARIATEAWQSLALSYERATQTKVARAPAIRIVHDSNPRPAESGTSQMGRVALRQNHPGVLDDKIVTTLRHEMGHQFLLTVCPQATSDRLFHEAFAVATSGEIGLWTSGTYLSTPRALRILERASSLDTPSSRRALARLLAESQTEPGGLPASLARRLRLCAAGARWSEPVTLAELASPGALASGSALVVLNRPSGEVLMSEGAANVPMPFGSTLKPFVLAGTKRRPLLTPDQHRAEWHCGDAAPAQMDAATALLRSCNGYFLDWSASDPPAASFGQYGPLLVKLGLGRLPVDMSEAIGLRPTLSLSPWAMAQAFRVLAERDPSVIEIMSKNAATGTLSGLKASAALAKVATKTGTVRDPRSRPGLGWIVAVTPDLVVVKTVSERAPRTFAHQLVKDLTRAEKLGGQNLARVQTFGLLPSWQVEARCPSLGVTLKDLELVATDFLPLMRLASAGPAMCVGAPWLIRFAGTRPEGRAYAGVFSHSSLPPPRDKPGAHTTRKQQRARRGSEILFTTSLARYTAGVLLSEDASIHGQARIALGRVIAHNATHSRHAGRPVCDTSHCQVFQGTRVPEPDDEEIFAGLPLAKRSWLLFSRGGSEPWRAERQRSAVEGILGTSPTGLTFRDGRVHYRRTARSPTEVFDEPANLPCDLLRVPLRLPSCPENARIRDGAFVFEGRGQGHGEGLDVEAAKASGLGAEEILRRAYGSH